MGGRVGSHSAAEQMPGSAWVSTVVALVCVVALLGCAPRSYAPPTIESVGITHRAHHQTEDDLTVRVSVPGADETEALFGLPLYDRGIQPVWIEVENASEQRVRFAPVGIDPIYFSPHEVAYMHKTRYKGDGFTEMERYFADTAMDRWIWPGETRSGFVYTHLGKGTKAFNVDLFTGSGRSTHFSFFVDVPGFEPDHASIDFATLYAEDEVRRVDGDALRDELGAISCCTVDASGEDQGLPINAVLVGSGPDVLQALLRAGWVEHERAKTPAQLERAQHWMGRPADAVFRNNRSKGGERNELRIWLSPIVADGTPVWMAQVTHFIGRSTELGRALFDPRLDPDVDDATAYLLQLMWYRQTLAAYAWLSTGHEVSIGQNAIDFRGVEYFTSGRRVVLWLSGEPVSQTETDAHVWDLPPLGSLK